MSRQAAWLGFALGLLCAHPAQAQDDDWAITREPARPAARTPARTESVEATRTRLTRELLAEPGSDGALDAFTTFELAQAGSLDAAIARLSEQRHARPDDAKLGRALARLQIGAGQVDAGLAELARMADDASASLRARLLSELGRHEEAAVVLLELAEHATTRTARAQRLRDAAREQLAAGDGEGALATLQRARHEAPASFASELDALTQQAQRASGHWLELAAELDRRAAFREAARLYEEQSDEAAAAGAYQKRIAQAPDDLESRAAWVRLLARMGRLDEARRQADVLLRRAPREPSYLVQWAELERAAGARAHALVRLQAEAARSSSLPLHRALRELYLRWQEPALAERELDRLLALSPSSPELRRAQADRALSHGDRALALSTLEKSYGASAPQQAELARVLAERDLVPEAIQHAQRALALAPDSLEQQRMLAGLLERAGRVADAEHAFRELLAQPGSRAFHDEAREHLVGLWRRSGSARLQLSELEAQQQRAGFDLERTRLLLALYARDPAQRVRRAALLAQLLAAQPEDAWALAQRVQLQLEQHDAEGALATELRALEASRATPEALASESERALGLALEHPREKATLPLVERTLVLHPRVALLQRLAGDVYRARDQPELARAAYQRAVALDPREFAAQYALALDAERRDDHAAVERPLRALLDAGDDGLRAEAAALALRFEGERGARRLLANGGLAERRALLQYYGRSALPSAQAALAGQASAAQQAQLRSTVAAALGLLLEALASGSPAERTLALTLLAAEPPPSALPPLAALAERGDVGQAERALAVVALGRAQGSAARLRALFASASRTLRPFLVWALGADAQPLESGWLDVAAADRDPAVRGMLALCLGRRAEAESLPKLRALSEDRSELVRAAATWALAQHRQPVEAKLGAPGASGALAVLALEPSSPSLSRALWLDASTGALAARRLTHERAPLLLPAPRWPFDLEAYAQQVADGALAPAAHPLAASVWPSVMESALAGLLPESDVDRRMDTLSALSVSNGGLAPRALLERGVCVTRAQSDALAVLLQPALSALLESRLAPRAAELLALSGGAARPELARYLQGSPPPAQRALLRTLASLPALPSALREPVEALRASPDWPTRMWAGRALKLDAVQLAADPIALVRTLQRPELVAPASICASSAGATN